MFGRTKPIGSVQIGYQCWSRPWMNENGYSQPVEASATSRLRQMFDPARRVDMIESSRDRPWSVGHRRDRNPKTIRWTWCVCLCAREGEGERGREGVEESSKKTEHGEQPDVQICS